MLRSGSSYFDAFVQKMSLTDGSCSVILPVELIAFKGELFHSKVGLSWTTASEKNNSYFTVMKSADGIVYEELGRVSGSGNSSIMNEYFMDDYSPNSPVTY